MTTIKKVVLNKIIPEISLHKSAITKVDVEFVKHNSTGVTMMTKQGVLVTVPLQNILYIVHDA